MFVAAIMVWSFFIILSTLLIQLVDGVDIITKIAGTGSSSYSGDNGAATSAGFSPYGVAIDSSSNLYIADYNNHRIRKVSVSTGIISTFAGTGATTVCCDGGQATAATLYYPYGVALDSSGNMLPIFHYFS